MIIAAGLAIGLSLIASYILTTTSLKDAHLRLEQEAFNYQQQNKYELKTAPAPPPGP